MATINGTNGNDRSDLGGNNLTGTGQADAIYGFGGSDWLDGRGGDDYLDGGDGLDTIIGGAGNDYVRDTGPAGWYDGGAGTDILDFSGIATAGAFDLAAGGGRFGAQVASGPGAFTMKNFESLYTGAGADYVWGTNGTNEIRSGAGADTVFGRGGTDTLRGELGDDYLDGGRGNDWIDGGDGDDVLYGAEGDDQLHGGAGDDEIYGGDGADVLVGGLGNDLIDGLGGYDTMSLAGLTAGATVTAAGTVVSRHGAATHIDEFFRIEKVVGTFFSDSIAAGSMAVDASTGDDTIFSGSAGNVIDGGAGSDTVSYLLSTKGVGVNLATGAVSGGFAAGDTLSRIENVTGSNHADTLRAGAAGSALTGAGGNDTLIGGSGADRFVFTQQADSPWKSDGDTIRGFQKGIDRIDLAALDANLGAAGNQAFTKIIVSERPYMDAAFTAGTIAVWRAGDQTTVHLNLDGTDTGTGGSPYDEIEMSFRLDSGVTLALGDFIL